MTTSIRPEISSKNKYWIDRHRYYELKHFCLQYRGWKQKYATLNSLAQSRIREVVVSPTGNYNSPVETAAEEREVYSANIHMVERAALEADTSLSNYILKGVTEGISYDVLKARLDIPCSKEVYYNLYRRFFWLLDRARK